MRTIDGIVAHYKALDENTAVTHYFIRQKLLVGEIPCVKAGNKRLVSIGAVDAYLAGEQTIATAEPDGYGRIRRIT